MSIRILNRSFSGGEITPELFGRLELSKVQEALALCMNFITLPHGPVINRPGTEFVEEVKISANPTRLIPFTYSNTQTFAIQVGAGYFRFHTQGGTVQAAASVWISATSYSSGDMVTTGGVTYSCITANTNSSPVASAWATSTAYSVGNMVSQSGVTYICVYAHTSGSGNQPPSSNFWTPLWRTTAWLSTYTYSTGDLVTSGGVTYSCIASTLNNAPPNATYWYALPANGDYEISNPYAAADLMDIHYTQSADVLTLVHPNYPIMELRRYGAINWRLKQVTFTPSLPAPTSSGVVSNPISHSYVVVAHCWNTYRWDPMNPDATNTLPSEFDTSPSSVASCSNDLTQPGAYNNISWGPVPGAMQYSVYKIMGAGIYKIAVSSGLSFKEDSFTKPVLSFLPFPAVSASGPATISATPYLQTNAYVSAWPSGSGTTSYSYVVTALDEGSNESYQSSQAVCYNDLTTIPNKNTITFPAVSGAIRYNIYKLSYGVFGFIGQVAPSPRAGTFSRTTTTMTCTITAHGLANGQSCSFYFSDTSFGAQPGGTSYTVTVVDVNTFTIIVANAGATTGTVTQLGGSGLSFVDNNITADISRTPPLAPVNVLASTGNYPSAVAYYQQRRVFAGSTNQPQNVWATRSGTETELSYTIPSRDDNRLAFKISAREASAIRHIVPMQDLLFFSGSCEWKCSSTTGVLTPSTINVQPQSYIGANNVQPVVVGNAVLYAAARGGHIRQMNYNWQVNGYQSTDSSIFAPHLFDYNTIVDMTYSRGPIPILWCVSSSGRLLGMTYLPEQQIAAWHQHTTGVNDAFESICTISENNEDMLYCIVRRNINGTTKRFVERLHTRLFNTVADCHYVDCGMTYNLPAANTGSFTRSWTTVTCTIPHTLTAGQSCWLSFSDTTFGSLPGGTRYVVTNVVDGNNFVVNLPTPAAPVTITIANPGVITMANHGLAAGAPVVFSTTGTLPTGITAGTTYYVANQTANTFQIAATPGGAAIATSGTQSGVAPSAPVTISIAAPGVVTWNAHGLPAGTAVVFSTTGALPTGIAAGTAYYVVSPTANTFQIAATPDAAAITTSGTQSGTQTCTGTQSGTQTCGYVPGAAVAISIANPGIVTLTNHGFAAGAPILFSTTGALPTGIATGTTYYVLNPTANTFQIAATPGGAAIATSGVQSGKQTCVCVAGAASGNVTRMASTISGLNWLAGMTVNILADGAVVPPQLVPTTGPNANTITLPVGASQVHIGLPLTAQLQTPPAAQAAEPAMAQGLSKNVNKVFLRTYRSSGILAGPDFADLTPYRQRSTENPGSPPNLVSDEVEILLSNDWGMSGQICIQQSDPLPLDIASMTLEIAVGGGV